MAEGSDGALAAGLAKRRAEVKRASTALAAAESSVRHAEARIAELRTECEARRMELARAWLSEGPALVVAANREGLRADVEDSSLRLRLAMDGLRVLLAERIARRVELAKAQAEFEAVEKAGERRAAASKLRRERRADDEGE